MPSALFLKADRKPEFAFFEREFPLTEGRGEVSYRIQLAPVLTESWEAESLNLSLLFSYKMKFFAFTEPGKKALEESLTARKAALAFAEAEVPAAEKSVSTAGAALTNAEKAVARALEANEFAVKLSEEKAGNEFKQKAAEAGQAVEVAKQAEQLAKQTIEIAKKELEAAHREVESQKEEVKKVEKEIAERGLDQAIDGLTKGGLSSAFVELGESGEAELISDMNVHRSTIVTSGKEAPSGKAFEVIGEVIERVDQHFELTNPVHLGERSTLLLTLVFTSGPNPEERYGPLLIATPSKEVLDVIITRAQLQYAPTSLAEKRREPQGPRPGR